LAMHGQNDDPKVLFNSELKLVTSLFVDIVGSLEAISDIGPQKAGMLLENCREQLTRIAHLHFGTVGTIAGDGILFLFGAPTANSKQASNACLAALAMIAATHHKDWPLTSLAVRIGLSTGETLVRPIKTDIGWHYDATAVSVHLASRLQIMAEPGAAICEKLTHDLAGEGFLFEDIGQNDIRGFGRALNLYQLTGMETNVLTSAKTEASTFLGRESELAQLTAISQSSAAAVARVIIIAGEAGIGKSRLLAEVNSTIKTSDTEPALFCRGFYGLVEPFSAVRECVKQLVPDADQINQDTFIEQVKDGLPNGQSDTIETTSLRNLHKELFDRISNNTDDLEGGLDTSIGKKLNTIRHGFEYLINAKRCPGTLVVLIDELLELDSESREIFLGLMSPTAPFPGTFILTCRSERVSELLSNDLRNIEIVKIGGLSDEHSASMVAEFQATATANTISTANQFNLHEIIRKSGGNPLFLKEILTAFFHSPSDSTDRMSRFPTVVSAAQTPVLQSVIAERIDQLTHEQKRVLKVASILGEFVSESILSQVLSRLEYKWTSVEQIASGGILNFSDELDGRQIRFTHPLFREIAAASIVESDQISFHTAAFEVICLSSNYSGKAAALTKARHAKSAHLWAESCEGYVQAAAAANERAMNSQAIELLSEALETSQNLAGSAMRARTRVDILLEMRNPLYQIGDLAGVEHSLNAAKEALDGYDDPIAHGKILSFESHVHWLRGRPSIALERANQIILIAESAKDEALVARGNFHAGLANLGIENFEESVKRMEMVAEVTSNGLNNENLGVNSGLLVLSQSYMARSLMSLGRRSESVVMAQKARASAQRSDDIFAHIIAQMSAGVVLLSAQEWGESKMAFDATLQLLESVEARLMQPIFESNYGYMLLCTGELDRGMGLIQKSIDESAKIGLRFELGRKHLNLALCHLVLGDKDATLRTLEKSVESSTQSEETHTASVAAILAKRLKDIRPFGARQFEDIFAHPLNADPMINVFSQTLANGKVGFLSYPPKIGH